MSEFNPANTRFSLQNSLYLAQAALLSYKSKTAIQKNITQTWGFDRFTFLEAKDTQAFVCANAHMILMCFRGTESLTDWQTNLKTNLVGKGRIKVHKGFQESLDLVWGALTKALLSYRDSRQSIWLTGHSLGGALATLTANRLLQEGVELYGLYTFGQSRVGNKYFADSFDRVFKHRAFRFVNNEDIVTRLPPRALGYRHVGTVRYFDNKGKLHKNKIRWRRFLDTLESIEERSLDRYKALRHKHPNGITDHSLDQYIKHIKANLTKEKNVHPRTFLDYINQ